MTTPFKPLTQPDAAEILGISIRTVQNWIDEGILKAPRKIGGRVYWHPAVFYGWLEQQLCCPDESPAARQGGPTPAKSRAEKSPLPVKSEKERLRARDEDKLAALLS